MQNTKRKVPCFVPHNFFESACTPHTNAQPMQLPKSTVYEEGYMVRHLGYGIDPVTQIPTILGENGIPVILIGKVADIVSNDRGTNFTDLVDTETIFGITLKEIEKLETGLCV